MQDHGLVFDCTKTAAKYNSKLLKKYGYDYGKLVAAHPNSVISMGSEFRPIHQIEPLLHRHQDWNYIRAVLKEGGNYPMIDDVPDPEQLRKNLIDMIDRGNHKSSSTKENKPVARKTIINEVCRAWSFPITIETLLEIPEAMYVPVGIADQIEVNENGEYVPKKRWIHDCSLSLPNGWSLNNLVDMSALPKCKYGHALLRYLYQTHIARCDHPNTIILQIKTDLDAAYRRMHAEPKIAIKQVTLVDGIAYVECRLPFGSSPAPAIYCTTSDSLFDLANDLTRDPHWDPDDLSSSMKNSLPDPEIIDNAVPFAPAKKLAVPVPSREIFIDGYVDDGVGACLHIKNNLKNFNTQSHLH